MRSPLGPRQFVVFALLLIFLTIIIQLGVFTIVLDKLNVPPAYALLVLFASLIGSTINLPLFKLSSDVPIDTQKILPFQYLFNYHLFQQGKTLVSINVGGAIIPILVSLYLMMANQLANLRLLFAVVIVTLISHTFSRPIKGLGIGMPIFIAPLTAALTALTLAPEQSAPVAYIAGSMGVLIGADILRIPDIRTLGVPMASIGGAGTFDGIFYTGLIAVLLA